MAKFFRVTYSIVSPESCEHGDFAGHGFLDSDGGRDAFQEDGVECSNERRAEIIAADHNMTLRDAMNLIGCCEDSGNWFTETDGRDNYQTGENEQRSLHLPDNVTPASYVRVGRLLGVR